MTVILPSAAQPPSVDDSASVLWHELLLPAIGGVGLLVLVLALWVGASWLIDKVFSKNRVKQWEEVSNPRSRRR